MESSLHSESARGQRTSQLDMLPVVVGGARLEVKHSGDGLVMASLGPISIAIWKSKPTRLLFEIQRNELAKVVDQHRGTAAFVCLIQEDTPDPDDDVRKASADMLAHHGTNLAGVACVIEGSGFRAAITRTVLTGIMMLTRNAAPIRFFDNIQGAATFLATRIGKDKVAGLAESVARLR